MALSDLILSKGEVIVIQSSSSFDIVSVDRAINFGTIQMVNDLCDTISVGQSVWFNINKAIPFRIISGQKFYKVLEQDISSAEKPA